MDRRKALWAVIVVLCFALASLTAYSLLAAREADPDMFWHVATGRWIVEHRAVPTTDVFSWYGIERGSGWFPQSWLYGLFAYGLFALGGFPLLYAVTALMEGALFLLVYALALARSRRPVLALALGMLALIGTMPNYAPRPQMLTFCLILVVALLLEKRLWYWALPVVLLGVNVHGGVWPVYALVVAYYALPEKPSLLALTLAAVVVNPRGLALLGYPFPSLGYAGMASIQEFQPTALAREPWNLLAFLAVLLAVWGKPVKPKDGALALAFTALSLWALRHLPFFYIMVPPILSPYMAGTNLAAEETAASTAGEPAEGRRRAGFVALDLVLVAVLVLGIGAVGYTALHRPIDVHRGYPAGAVAYMRRNGSGRLFNVYQDGGYLIFAGIQPMVDGRGDPYFPAYNKGADLFTAYMRTYRLEDDYRAFFDAHRIELVLVDKAVPLYGAIRHDRALAVLQDEKTHVLFRYTPSAGGTTTASP